MDAGRLTRGRPVATRGVLEARTTRAGSALGPNFAVRTAFIWPALLVILFVSIFPLFASLYISLSRLELARGGFTFHFIGVENFRELLFGGERTHFLGVSRPLTALGWVVLVAGLALLCWGLARAWRGGVSLVGMAFRLVGAFIGAAGLWLLTHTLLSHGGRPGTVVVTLVYVAVGIAAQFLVGLTDFSWVTSPWGARVAVMIGDIWQWTPFMFIVLLAALESQDLETVEAAMVDGANRWQTFRHVTLPAILPVCTTVILIRLIEAFKIIDLPNVLTNGGPGTATESLSLHAYVRWRTLDLGQSAAVAYSLLFIVTLVAVAYVSLLRRRFAEE